MGEHSILSNAPISVSGTVFCLVSLKIPATFAFSSCSSYQALLILALYFSLLPYVCPLRAS